MIKFNSRWFQGSLVATLLSLAGTTGCTTPLEEAIDGVGAQIDELTTVIENQDPPVVNVTDGDVTVNPPDVDVTVNNPPTSQPTTPTASDFPNLENLTSHIREDVSGENWTLTGGTWDGSFNEGVLDLLPPDWRNVVTTTHLLVVYDLSGNPITVPPIIVEGGIIGHYHADPEIVDLSMGCSQTTIRLRNSISNELRDLTLPEACR